MLWEPPEREGAKLILLKIPIHKVIPRTTKDMNGSTVRVMIRRDPLSKPRASFAWISSRDYRVWRAIRMWHHEDGASIATSPSPTRKSFISKIYRLMRSRDSLESTNCGLFMKFLCNFTFSFHPNLSLDETANAKKSKTNELILYSFGWREMFLWL